jgi:hypothetical protein
MKAEKTSKQKNATWRPLRSAWQSVIVAGGDCCIRHRQVDWVKSLPGSNNTSMKTLFLHGWQSVPGGVKPTYLAQHGHEIINPKLPDDDFEEAVNIAQAAFDKHQPDVVVGSSRGGAVTMNIKSGNARLVLLCPAWKKYGTAKTARAGTVILHSRADDVIPFADSEELVRNSGLPAYTLVEVGHDHRLADPESLEMMLKACADNDELAGHDGPWDAPEQLKK